MKIQHLVDPDKHSSSVVNMTAFFFREGVWHHAIFVSRQNIKERDTHVSRKSCRIQSIWWRLRNSWSVSTFVCHMHQTFSQRSVDVTSEAETMLRVTESARKNVGGTLIANVEYLRSKIMMCGGNPEDTTHYRSKAVKSRIFFLMFVVSHILKIL